MQSEMLLLFDVNSKTQSTRAQQCLISRGNPYGLDISDVSVW